MSEAALEAFDFEEWAGWAVEQFEQVAAAEVLSAVVVAVVVWV